MRKMETVFLFFMLMVAPSSQWIGKSTEVVTSQSSYIKQMNCSTDSQCPTWFTCDLDKSCRCENSRNDAVVCDNDKLSSAVLDSHCVTYNEESRSTFVGACFFNCGHLRYASKKESRAVYHYLPKSPKMLINNSVCTYFHRTGLLCGDCEEGYSPFVLSYNLSCAKCPDSQTNWWHFILVGFGPLTIFYVFVVLFNINVTSSRLRGVVWFSQMGSIPAFVRFMLASLKMGNYLLQLKIAKVFFVFYSFWNLDVLRSVIPDTCLNVSTVQMITLDYLIALYPFALILLSCIIIKIYDQNLAFMKTALKPLKTVLEIFRRCLDIRTSVIDSFSTFFLLSYVKVLSVTGDLLIPTEIYQLGSNMSRFGLFYSPTVVYFGDEHLPYAILAIITLAVFVVVPTIIFALYPCQFFQKFLSLIPINWHFLHAFVDSFQGCYKDGTEPGTLDCRWFSVIKLIIQLLLFLAYGLTLSNMFFIYAIILLTIYMIALINIQPYKKITSNYIPTDLIFFYLLNFIYIAVLGREYSSMERNMRFHAILTVASLSLAIIPVVYIIFLICLWIFSRRRIIR